MLTLSGCVIKRNDFQEWLHDILKLMSVTKNKNIGKTYYNTEYADSLKVVLNEFSLQSIVIIVRLSSLYYWFFKYMCRDLYILLYKLIYQTRNLIIFDSFI